MYIFQSHCILLIKVVWMCSGWHFLKKKLVLFCFFRPLDPRMVLPLYLLCVYMRLIQSSLHLGHAICFDTISVSSDGGPHSCLCAWTKRSLLTMLIFSPQVYFSSRRDYRCNWNETLYDQEEGAPLEQVVAKVGFSINMFVLTRQF